jgi:hypothetical protein
MKFHASLNLNIHHIVNKMLHRHLMLLHPIHIFLNCFCKVRFETFLPPMSGCLKHFHPLRFLTGVFKNLLFPHAYYMFHPSLYKCKDENGKKTYIGVSFWGSFFEACKYHYACRVIRVRISILSFSLKMESASETSFIQTVKTMTLTITSNCFRKCEMFIFPSN